MMRNIDEAYSKWEIITGRNENDDNWVDVCAYRGLLF